MLSEYDNLNFEKSVEGKGSFLNKNQIESYLALRKKKGKIYNLDSEFWRAFCESHNINMESILNLYISNKSISSKDC